MNNYEGMFIINPQLSDDEREKVINEVQDEINKNNGKVLNIDHMGIQHLAYSINKCNDGYYILVKFQSAPDAIDKLTARYKINGNILRNLLIAKK